VETVLRHNIKKINYDDRDQFLTGKKRNFDVRRNSYRLTDMGRTDTFLDNVYSRRLNNCHLESDI